MSFLRYICIHVQILLYNQRQVTGMDYKTRSCRVARPGRLSKQCKMSKKQLVCNFDNQMAFRPYKNWLFLTDHYIEVDYYTMVLNVISVNDRMVMLIKTLLRAHTLTGSYASVHVRLLSY